MLHINHAWEVHVNQDLFISHTVSVHSNMHSSHVATENCMKCGFSYETDCCRNYCEESFWMNLDILCRCRSLTMEDLTECCMLTMHGSHMLIKIPTLNDAVNHAWELNINQDSRFISHSFSKRIIKIHLKITWTWHSQVHTSGSHVAINVHGNYYYMVEGSPHVWLTCGN